MDKKNWYDLDPHWDDLRGVAYKRDEQKSGFASSRYWNPDSHFYGLLGEHIWGEATHQPVNTELLIEGDRGIDFPDTDIKTCTYWDDPWLKHPVNRDLPVSTYVLIGLDLARKRGYIAGWASKEDLLKAEIKTWRSDAGPQRSIRHTNLRRVCHSCGALLSKDNSGHKSMCSVVAA